jgi:FAD/FMN-containing dehydrogenase
MNKVHGFDEAYGILKCDAGCILENLQQELSQYGYQPSVDLGSKGSA